MCERLAVLCGGRHSLAQQPAVSRSVKHGGAASVNLYVRMLLLLVSLLLHLLLPRRCVSE